MRLVIAVVLAGAAILPALASAQDNSGVGSEMSSSMEPPLTFSDADLEHAVRAAYNGASAFASMHGNYFSRDDVFPPLRDAVRAELLQEGFASVAPPEAPAASLADAKICLTAPGAQVRIVPTLYGDGIALVGVTDTRDFVYDYDPHKSADIVVTAAENCSKAN